jgi:hypothetical protein
LVLNTSVTEKYNKELQIRGIALLSIHTSTAIYNVAAITHIDEYITGIVICIGIPQATGANFDASSMLFPKYNLYHIFVPLEPQLCNIIQHRFWSHVSLNWRFYAS